MKAKIPVYLIFFVQIFGLLSFSSKEKQSNAYLSLEISADKDTCFYTKDKILNLTITLKNNRILPYAM